MAPWSLTSKKSRVFRSSRRKRYNAGLGEIEAKLSKDVLIVRNNGTLPAPAKKRLYAVTALKWVTITKTALHLHQEVQNVEGIMKPKTIKETPLRHYQTVSLH